MTILTLERGHFHWKADKPIYYKIPRISVSITDPIPYYRSIKKRYSFMWLKFSYNIYIKPSKKESIKKTGGRIK